MSGFRIITDLHPQQAAKIAQGVAKDLGFRIVEIDDLCFFARKGSLPMSIFLGAFIAYCDFQITVEEVGSEKMELTLERNKPWWIGVIGLNRVKNAAKALAAEVADCFDEEGGRVIEEEEF